jgi:hypothetical protein
MVDHGRSLMKLVEINEHLRIQEEWSIEAEVKHHLGKLGHTHPFLVSVSQNRSHLEKRSIEDGTLLEKTPLPENVSGFPGIATIDEQRLLFFGNRFIVNRLSILDLHDNSLKRLHSSGREPVGNLIATMGKELSYVYHVSGTVVTTIKCGSIYFDPLTETSHSFLNAVGAHCNRETGLWTILSSDCSIHSYDPNTKQFQQSLYNPSQNWIATILLCGCFAIWCLLWVLESRRLESRATGDQSVIIGLLIGGLILWVASSGDYQYPARFEFDVLCGMCQALSAILALWLVTSTRFGFWIRLALVSGIYWLLYICGVEWASTCLEAAYFAFDIAFLVLVIACICLLGARTYGRIRIKPAWRIRLSDLCCMAAIVAFAMPSLRDMVTFNYDMTRGRSGLGLAQVVSILWQSHRGKLVVSSLQFTFFALLLLCISSYRRRMPDEALRLSTRTMQGVSVLLIVLFQYGLFLAYRQERWETPYVLGFSGVSAIAAWILWMHGWVWPRSCLPDRYKTQQ